MRSEIQRNSKGLGFARSWCGRCLVLLWALSFVPFAYSQDVLTYHNDNARTGLNPNETILTPANVNSSAFGKLFLLSVDGKVDAQPLYLSNVTIPNKGTHNLLFVATEHDSVYAFDADTGAVLWQVSLLKPGESTSDDHGCGQVTPEIGITATPVIDRSSGPNGSVYLVAMSKDSSRKYFQRLHALDVTTGAEQFGGPVDIQAQFPGIGDNSNGTNVIFDPGQYKERPALLLLNHVIYTTWASHCDFRPYTGWVISYDENTLAQVSVLNVTPNGNEGAIWASGGGPAADSSGNIYFLDANGTFDTTLNAQGFPSQGDYGNAFLKLSTINNTLAVADYFQTFDQATLNNNDTDLGSGAALLLPDMTDALGKIRHLAVGAGKDGNIYLADRDNMGKFNPANNSSLYQELPGALPGGEWANPAYFNNRLYYGPVGGPIYAFQFSTAKLSSTLASRSVNTFNYPGATPSVSANGVLNGIVWATENTSPAVLHAYDASDLSNELYNSNQAGARDQFGAGNKFITPTIANGKAYVGTTNGVGVFGLTPPKITTQPVNQTVTAGQTATFTAAATGSPTPTVQWQVSTDGGVTFSNVSGATSTTLSFTTVLSQSGNRYRAVFTNSAGTATTTAATLTVNSPTPPTITTQPANQTVIAGQTATFTAAATGSPTPTVQWQVSTDGGMTFSNVSGATSTTLSFTTALSQSGNRYRAMFTNSAGTATTTAATLTVNSGPPPPPSGTVTVQNTNSNLCIDTGGSTSFTALIQSACSTSNTQKFTLTAAPVSGWYYLVSAASNLCWDVAGGSGSAGALIQQYTCVAVWPEYYQLKAVSGGYEILSGNMSNGCLDVVGASTASGANIEQNACIGSKNQIFNIQ